jgi:hypothetical protein
MKKSRNYVCILLSLFIVLCLSSCEHFGKTEWKFVNNTSYTVTITDLSDGDPSDFTISPYGKESVYVSEFDSQCGFTYSPSNHVYTTQYSSLQEVDFWTK